MSEVEKLCEYVTIIRDGQTAETGSVEKLRHLSAHEITARVSRETSGLREIEGSTFDDGTFHATVSREQVPDVLRRVLEAGGEDITSAPASIEEMFLQHYGDAR